MQAELTQIILLPALLWVVFSDLIYRRIANWLIVALLLLWLLSSGWLAWHGMLTWSAIGSSLLAAALVLILGYVLFAMRWMGAGDVKLMAVLCLWLGQQAFAFLMITSLIGGVLALGMPLLRVIEPPLALAFARLTELLGLTSWPRPMALQEHAVPGIPYGIAIALGAAFVMHTV
jgi:prepilin peptidase CpaA